MLCFSVSAEEDHDLDLCFHSHHHSLLLCRFVYSLLSLSLVSWVCLTWQGWLGFNLNTLFGIFWQVWDAWILLAPYYTSTPLAYAATHYAHGISWRGLAPPCCAIVLYPVLHGSASKCAILITVPHGLWLLYCNPYLYLFFFQICLPLQCVNKYVFSQTETSM